MVPLRPAAEEALIEPLEVGGLDFGEPAAAEVGEDVEAEIPLIRPPRLGAEVGLGTGQPVEQVGAHRLAASNGREAVVPGLQRRPQLPGSLIVAPGIHGPPQLAAVEGDAVAALPEPVGPPPERAFTVAVLGLAGAHGVDSFEVG